MRATSKNKKEIKAMGYFLTNGRMATLWQGSPLKHTEYSKHDFALPVPGPADVESKTSSWLLLSARDDKEANERFYQYYNGSHPKQEALDDIVDEWTSALDNEEEPDWQVIARFAKASVVKGGAQPGAGRPLGDKGRIQEYRVTLYPDDADALRALSDGNLSAGIREALRLAVTKSA